MMVAKTRQATARPNKEERLENAARREALKELIKTMGKNGGKAPYGAVDKIVKTYNSNGFKAVTRQNLYYRLSKLKSGKSDDNSQLIGASIVTSSQMEGVLSDLTEEHVFSDVSNTQRDSQNEIQFISTTNIGGRKKKNLQNSLRKKAI